MDRPTATVANDWLGVRSALPFDETTPMASIPVDQAALSEAQRNATAREAEATTTESDKSKRPAASDYGSASTTAAASVPSELSIDDITLSAMQDEDDWA